MKKKIIIPIVIIVILSAILCVEVLHFIQKDSSDINKNPPAGTTYINKQDATLEKGIDLHGTYSENDLEIKKESIKVDGFEKDVEIVQISGLKNKKIEDKINNEIKQRQIDSANSIANAQKEKDNNLHSRIEVVANFSNVLSIKVDFWNNGSNSYTGLNYNLVTGEKIEFSDLFNKNDSLESIVRQIIYKSSIHVNHNELDAIEGDPGFIDEPYYDAEKGAWYATYYWYDFDTNKEHSEKREYVLALDENEIEKYTKKFLNSNSKEFYFSPAKLTILINGEEYNIFLAEIANKVAIYDKYLTEESIFEKDDIGAKSVVNCSFEKDFGKLKEAKFESNNFFYDMSFYLKYSDKYPTNDFTNQNENKTINDIKTRVNECREKASNDPNKAYFLFLIGENSNGDESYSEYNYATQDYNTYTMFNSLYISDIKEKLIICDISEKDKVLEQILSCYRYYNLSMYGSIYYYLENVQSTGDYDIDSGYRDITIDGQMTKTIKHKYYDVVSKEEYKEVKDIFKDDVDYKSIIKNNLVSHIKYDSNALVSLTSYGIHVLNNENGDTISFRELTGYLKLKNINPDGSVIEEQTNEETNTNSNNNTNAIPSSTSNINETTNE